MERDRSSWDAETLGLDRIPSHFQHLLRNIPVSDTGGELRWDLQPQDYYDFLADGKDPSGHFLKLNERLASLILQHCSLSRQKSTWEILAIRARGILSRLPRFPPIPQLNFGERHLYQRVYRLGLLPDEYLLPGLEPDLWTKQPEADFAPFHKLKVVSTIDDATILLVLISANALDTPQDLSIGFQLKRCLDLIARLLDGAFDTEVSDKSADAISLAVVAAFLWTAWHRSVTIYLAWVLQYEMLFGPSNEDLLVLSYPKILHSHLLRQKLHDHLEGSVPVYICPWALKLLQTSKASLAFDYRSLYKRFGEAHPLSQMRCTERLNRCAGISPETCGRFSNENLRWPEGSVHDGACTNCPVITWDERSYRKVSGGRAVDVSKSSTRAMYCKADSNTLAVTHVWAHGQGGRPATGINRCLHDRYVKLAKARGCKSYWIDTLCIPEAHDIRKEAIAHINPTFSESKITLVCDRDIMALKKPSDSLSTAYAEQLLATLLVCDWSVRAWTMFESTRGRHNLHLLCAENELFSLKYLVTEVLDKGSIDLAVLALAIKHSIPRTTPYKMSIMEASSLLSHRHATRAGDDILIWSLMSRQPAFTDDPKSFWLMSIGRYLNTGYLMSTAPRLEGVRFFSWAPSSPNVRGLDGVLDASDDAYSSDGEGSEIGRVTDRGFEAIWLIYQVRDEDNGQFSADASRINEDDSNPCWEAVERLRRKHRRVCLLIPKAVYKGEYIGAEETKRRNKLVAIAFSDSATVQPILTKTGSVEDQWTWSGVYEWPRDTARPWFDWESILLM